MQPWSEVSKMTYRRRQTISISEQTRDVVYSVQTIQLEGWHHKHTLSVNKIPEQKTLQNVNLICCWKYTPCHWTWIYTYGSFHVRSTSVLQLPLPICLKFGKFIDIYCTFQQENVQQCKLSGKIWLWQMRGKRIKKSITLVLIWIESWLVTPIKVLE